MFTFKLRFLATVGSAVIALLLLAVVAYGQWSAPQQITTNSTVNTNANLALDNNGKAHLVYQSGEGTATEIYYATNASGSWQTVRLTKNKRVDFAPDIAVYKNRPYIVFASDDPIRAGGDLEIIYLKKTSTGFRRVKLTNNVGYDSNPAIAVYARRPFITWEKIFANREKDIELMFATYINGSWVKRRLIKNKANDEFPDIAVDNYGRARVVFQRKKGSYDSEIFHLIIISPDKFYLKKLTNNSVNDVDPHISIAGGKTFIVYQVAATGAIRLIRHIRGVGWLASKRIVPPGNNGLPKIVARNGQAHVVYTTSDPDNSLGMRYLTSLNNWSTVETISNDASETVAEGFAVDSYNHLHLVYENALFNKDNEVISSSLNYIIK